MESCHKSAAEVFYQTPRRKQESASREWLVSQPPLALPNPSVHYGASAVYHLGILLSTDSSMSVPKSFSESVMPGDEEVEGSRWAWSPPFSLSAVH